MANNNFYGYSNKKPELTLPNGNIDIAFEKVNPYEFRKGMDYELTKMGCRNLNSSTPEQREKATTTVLKKLDDMSGYYSNLIAYETEYRNVDKKPSFKKFVEDMADHGMKEVDQEFKADKMAKVKLREAISKIIKENIDEIKFPPHIQKGIDFHRGMSDETITRAELLDIIKDNQAALNMDPNLGGDMMQLAVKFGDEIPQVEVDKLVRQAQDLADLKEDKTTDEGFYSSPSDMDETGLNVIPRDQIHANKLKDALENSSLYAEWNASQGFFFFPEEQDLYDELEREIEMLMDENDIQASIEGVFQESVNENKTQKINKMTKEELDKMIMEELDAYLREEDEITVDVEDGDEDGESDDVLRKIYDMLKDMFEGEDEEVEDEVEEEEADEEEADEEEVEEEEEELEEEMDMEEKPLQERFQKLANIVKG